MRADGHAVVLGSGIAGLLAARVLARAYRRVTVVERDTPVVNGEPRKGVPQGRHAHVLLPRGQQILDDLFPAIDEDLIDGGAVVADPGADHRYIFGGHRMARSSGADRAIQTSRPLLEGVLRERVRALPDVCFAEGCDVVGLTAPDRRRISGVRVMRRQQGSAEEEIPADLVVDATGRGGRSQQWLEHLGYGPVPYEEVKLSIACASRPLRPYPGALADKAVVVGPRPDRPRTLTMVAVEGDRYLLTVAGLDPNHRPPTDPGGFLGYLAGLAPSDVLEAVCAAEPLGDIAAYRYPSDLRRRYERLRRLPDGLVVIGDALCSFSPVYAQGMSVACLEAEVLARCLAAGTHGLARRYFRAVVRALDDPWRMSVAADLSLPEVRGRRTPSVRVLNAYTKRVQAAAARDAVVAGQFLRVIGLLDPPGALMRPSILSRSLRRSAGTA